MRCGAGGAPRRYGEPMTPEPARGDPASPEPTSGDPVRSPLPAAELRRALVTPGGLWTDVRVVSETGSTNADVADAARGGAAEGLVVAADYQHAGRGRAGRGWSSPPRAGLAVSVLLRPGTPAAGWPGTPSTRWGWLPLLAGVAIAESVTELAAVPALLKWPNDLLIEGRKCAGILAEVVGDALVLGFGLNVTTGPAELPPTEGGRELAAPPATSLLLAGARTTDRAALLRQVLRRLEDWYGRWRDAGGDADGCGLRPAYQRSCATLGRPVRVLLPDGSDLTGLAEHIDPAGRLVLHTADGPRTLAAGDVHHLRAAAS